MAFGKKWHSAVVPLPTSHRDFEEGTRRLDRKNRVEKKGEGRTGQGRRREKSIGGNVYDKLNEYRHHDYLYCYKLFKRYI